MKPTTHDEAVVIVSDEFLQYQSMQDGRNEEQVLFDEAFVNCLCVSSTIQELLDMTIEAETSEHRKDMVDIDIWMCRVRSIINAKVQFLGLVELYMTGRAFLVPRWKNDYGEVIKATFLHVSVSRLCFVVCSYCSGSIRNSPKKRNRSAKIFNDLSVLEALKDTFSIPRALTNQSRPMMGPTSSVHSPQYLLTLT